jgi:ribonuclease HI
MSDEALLWFDGASLRNPGPAGAGAIVQFQGRKRAFRKSLGTMTNNQAEYHGVILALRQADAAGARRIVLHGDSQLVLRQLEGRYAVKHAGLKPLHAEASQLLRRFEGVRFVWVPRAENQEADAEAGAAALDQD